MMNAAKSPRDQGALGGNMIGWSSARMIQKPAAIAGMIGSIVRPTVA